MAPDIARLSQALAAADLDELFPLVKDHLRIRTDHLLRLLSPFFAQAQATGVNLQRPSAELSELLSGVAATNRNGTVARPNTVRARLGAMSALYTYAVAVGAVTEHPMQGLQRPPKEFADLPGTPREQVQRLHGHTRRHADLAALHAALVLIDEHALKVSELLSLTWDHLNLTGYELARSAGRTPLSQRAKDALMPLVIQAGGLLGDESLPARLDTRRRLFPWPNEATFRAELMRACRATPIPYASPGDLRRASLRDHPHTPRSAGYAPEDGERQLARATNLARTVAQALHPEE
ncbi:hypothetical protein [Deinococcus arcticus]|nr:hypothetical protein [Deinococcus arcticus]